MVIVKIIGVENTTYCVGKNEKLACEVYKGRIYKRKERGLILPVEKLREVPSLIKETGSRLAAEEKLFIRENPVKEFEVDVLTFPSVKVYREAEVLDVEVE